MWYKLSVGNGITAEAPSLKAIEVLLPALLSAGQPLDMAVFLKDGPDSFSKQNITIYFSPSAALAICKHFPDASPCEKPSKVDLVLLAGDRRCFDLLFP